MAAADTGMRFNYNDPRARPATQAKLQNYSTEGLFA